MKLTRRKLLKVAPALIAAPALILPRRARGWTHGSAFAACTASVPAPAVTWSLNTLAWCWKPEASLADIDQTHTGSTPPPSGSFAWTTKDPFNGPAPDNALGISYNSGLSALEINSCASNSLARGICTTWNNAGNVHGRVLDMTKPFFIDCGFSLDESLSPAATEFVPCPSITLYSFFNVAAAGDEYLNKSISEFQSAGAGAVGYYANTFSGLAPAPGDYEAGFLLDRSSVGLTSPFTSSVFVANQMLYIPTTYNSGTGIIGVYANGSLPTANSGNPSYNHYFLASPATNCCSTGTNRNGAFSAAEVNGEYAGVVINAGVQEPDEMSGGPGWPCYIKYFNVWGADASVIINL